MSPSVVDMIKMEVATGNSYPHHRLAGIYEFRLQSSKEESEARASTVIPAATTTASSVGSDRLSIHKQKIDSMFDETRSSVSGAGTPTFSRRGRVILDDLEEEDEEEYDDVDDGKQNTVQERIQKMFAEVTEDESFKEARQRCDEDPNGQSRANTQNHYSQSEMKSSSQVNALNGFVAASIRPQVFSVHYLGSAPLPNRDATLQALQHPLKTLYFRYRALEICGRAPPLNGTLEISSEGLRVKMARSIEERKPGIAIKTEQLDKLNKFPSIAVWAAVKFVNRESEETAQSEESSRCAFLPLIADPDGRDKSNLFRTLQREEAELAKGLHSPMFAVVMRRSSRANGPNGATKRTLHCHAFVCACSEDAIVMAANLYQALVAGMSGAKKPKPKQECEEVEECDTGDSAKEQHASDQPARNDFRGMNAVSKRPSSVSGGEINRRSLSRQIDAMSSISAPVRPPRRKKSYSRYGDDARSSNSEEFLPPEDEEEPRRNEEPVMRRASSVQTVIHKSLSTTSLAAPKLPIMPKDTSGDIFTRVAIPRSGSFLEHGADLRRSTSMGLGDLFLEVRAQEGLTSLDAILEKIVDADGMSYARLKPLYREFLLKLATTLSRDELYQRSKSIMRRQLSSRRRRVKRLSRVNSSATDKNCLQEDEDISSTNGDNLGDERKSMFSWSLCTSSSKVRSKSSAAAASRGCKNKEGGKKGESCKGGGGGEGTSCNFEFTSVIFPSETRRPRGRTGSSSISSSISSASRGSKSRRQRRKQFHAHRPSFNAGRSSRGSHVQQPRPALNAADAQIKPRVSTSEDSSDFFSFKRRISARNAGTVDTNTKSSSRMGSSGTGLGGGRSSSGYVSCSDCSFDSESCNSDKCYCPQEPLRRHQNGRVSNGNRRDAVRNGMYAEIQHHRAGRACQRSDGGGCGSVVGNSGGGMRGHVQCMARQACIRQCGGREECHGRRAPACGCRARSCGGCQSVPLQSCMVRGQPAGAGCGMREVRCQHVSGRCCGCCCISRADSPSTAWHKNERRVNGKVVDADGGIEDGDEDWEDEDDNEGDAMVLEDGASAISSSSWRPGSAVPRSRMEVYATLPPPRPLPDAPANGQRDVAKATYHNCGDAAKSRLGVEIRQRVSHVNDCVTSIEAKQQKVLVVSARDPKGRVICMGRGDQSNVTTASSHGGHHMHPSRHQHGSKSAATEALSVKKSAEIAAIFSDATAHKYQESVVSGEEVVYTTLESPRQGVFRSKGIQAELLVGRNHSKGNSLENTLGYLP